MEVAWFESGRFGLTGLLPMVSRFGFRWRDMPDRPQQSLVEHARCFLGMENAYPGRIAICFEAWVTDREYRRALCDAMKVEFDDRAFGKVGHQGGGSSFDGMSFEGRGYLMNVLDRVSQLAPGERKVLDDILEDTELQGLCGLVQKADPYRQIQMVTQSGEYA